MADPRRPVPIADAAEMHIHDELSMDESAFEPVAEGRLREYCEKMALCQESDCIPLVFDEIATGARLLLPGWWLARGHHRSAVLRLRPHDLRLTRRPRAVSQGSACAAVVRRSATGWCRTSARWARCRQEASRWQ